MPIKLKCPNCRERLFADDSDRGRSIKCDGCGTRVPVPGDGGDAPPAAKSVPAVPVIPVAKPQAVNAPVVAKPKSTPAVAIPTLAPVTVAPVAKPRPRSDDEDDDRPRPRRRAADEEDEDFGPTPGKGNGLLFGILAVGVLLLAGIGVGVYFLVSDDGGEVAGNTTPPDKKPPVIPDNKPPVNPNPVIPNPVPKGNLPPGWDTVTGDGFTVALPPGVNEGQWGVNGRLGKIWTGREDQRERVAAYLTIPPGQKIDDLTKLVNEVFQVEDARRTGGAFENGRWFHQYDVTTVLKALKRTWVHVCQDRVYFFWFESADPPAVADRSLRTKFGDSIRISHPQGAVDARDTGPTAGPGPDPKPPETPFEPVATAADDGFRVQMPGGSKLKGERHQYGLDRKYQVAGKKFETKDGPYTFQLYYHDLADEADFDTDKCTKPMIPFANQPAGTDETVGGRPATRWELKGPFGGPNHALTVRAGFRVFVLVATKEGVHQRPDPELNARAKKFMDSFQVTFDPKKAPTEATDPAWTAMARTVGFTATAPKGTEIRDYQRGFRETEVKGKQYIAFDDAVQCVVTVVEFGPKVDPDSVLLDIHGRDKIVSGPTDVTQNGVTWKEFALGGFNNEVRARVRTFVRGNFAAVLKVETRGQIEREVALKARAFFNSFKLGAVGGGGTVTVGNGEFASAGKVQPFWTAVVLPVKKELITLGPRNPTDVKPGGILRRYSYPDFKLKATYHLPLPVTHAVADEAGGKLLCAVVNTWPTGPAALDGREGESWYADLQLFDLTRITTDGLYGDGEELKPLGNKIAIGSAITGLAVDPTGKFAYAAATVTPPPVKGQPPRPPTGRLYKIDLAKSDVAGPPINHKEPLNGLRMQAGGKALVSSELAIGGAVRPLNLVLVDPIGWRVARLLPIPAGAKDATFTGDGVLALLPSDNRNVLLGAADGAAEATDVTPKDIPLDGFAFLRVTADGKRAVASAGKKQNGLLLMTVTGAGDKAKFEKVTSGTTVAGTPTGGQFLLTPDSKYAVFNSGAVVDLEKTTAPAKE